VAIDKVGGRPGALIPERRPVPLTPADDEQTGGLHQTLDALAPDMDAVCDQLGMGARRPVRLARGVIVMADQHAQLPIGDIPCRGLLRRPSVEAAAQYADRPSQGLDGMTGLFRAYEDEDFARVASPCANQAAAFERMSCSIRNCLFSGRKRRSSSRSD